MEDYAGEYNLRRSDLRLSSQSRAADIGLVEPLSPELALVDPALAAQARATLPIRDVFAAVELLRTSDPRRPRRFAYPALGLLATAAAAWVAFSLIQRHEQPQVSRPGVAAAPSVPYDVIRRHQQVRMPGALTSRDPARAASPRDPARAASPRDPARAASSRGPARAAVHTPPKPARKHSKLQIPAKRTVKAKRHAPARTPAPAARTRVVKPVHAADVLTWPASPHATYYRVQVFAGRGKPSFLFEVWTTHPRLPQPSTYADGGHRRPLTPGHYRWVVFPVFGKRGMLAIGSIPSRPSATGRFVVTRRAR